MPAYCTSQDCYCQRPYFCTATADPYLHRRHSNTQRKIWLSLVEVTVPFPGSWCAQGFVCTLYLHLWQVWGLILNAIVPLLLSCCGFFFALRRDVSFFGGIQHYLVDGCSAASCDFGVLPGEDEHASFYSAILKSFFSKLGKEYVKAAYCHLVYLTYMQSTSCEMLGWMKHKLEARFLGELSMI